ncbi:MAG TPA: TolC family protein [Draconibacterium sp.]|nr:TolC family protein [Draconibacterium sp.]
MRKLFILLLLPAQLIFAQNEVSLDNCYSWARENYPSLKQAEIWQEITSLKKENTKTNFLPQVSLNGQVTYQSAVTKVDIAMPGISIPSVSKDQYKAYADFRQTIWDGGLTAANLELEDAVLKSNLSQVEVELYKLNDQVAQAFFTVLAINKQKSVLAAQKTTLQEQLKVVQSGIKNQVLEKSSALALEAEIINIEQNELQLDAGKNTALKMLSILTGHTISVDSKLEFQQSAISPETQFTRPELQLFSNQSVQLETQMNLLDKSRNPKVFGFGQAGYGRPGLNMLNDKFDSYYLVGLGLSWNVFDWKKTTRQKQVLQLQQQTIQHQEETFMQNMNLLLAQQSEQIDKLGKMLEKDNQLVELKTEITKTTASKLENGTINSAEYVRDLQAETVSKINRELHQIQLDEAKEKYNLIKGKTKK